MTRKVHALPEDELAAVAGISETTWKAHKKEGAPVPRTREGLATWLKHYHAWRRQNGKVQNGGGPLEPDRETNDHKRELAKLRVVLARLDVGERMGTLVPRHEVVETLARSSLAVRLRLNAMVKKLALRLGPLCGNGGEAHVEEQLQAEVDSICEAFARGIADGEDEGGEADAAGPGP